VELLFTEAALGLALGITRGLQQTRVKSISIINIIILIQTKIVLFQFHITLLNRGSSDSRVMDASYISGIPAPGWYSARCSIVTFKQEVGTSPSTNPRNLRFRVWDSET
jgi:hypothetical protein